MWRSDAWARRVLSDKLPCQYYFEWGHWLLDCPLFRGKKAPIGDPRLANPHFKLRKSSVCHPALRRASPPSQAGRSPANVASVQQQGNEQDVALLDSGATDSVTNDVSLFTSLRPTTMNLIVASTDWFPVRKVGDVVLPTPNGSLRISNVLFCLNIKGTIISVGKFKALDGKVEWDGDKYLLVQDGVIFSSIKSQNHCFIPILHPKSQVCAVALEPRLLHERVGHFSLRILHRTIKAGAIRDPPKLGSFHLKGCCDTCALMKSTHLPVKLPSRDICMEPGDVIAADVVGPYKAAIDGSQYFLTVQDLASGLVSAILMKTKGEATKELIRWLGQFVNLSKWAIRRIGTDNAFEFATSKELADFVLRMGIVHEKSALYEHHQNGAVERTNRTLTEMCRALIHTRGLPPTLWSYAVRHAAYIFNRLLHVGKASTPLEAVLGIRPTLDMLRVFGCVAYAHDHTHLKQVVPYAGKFRHVGILTDSKGWLLWSEDTGKVITEESVRFEEGPILAPVYGLSADAETEAVISAIECHTLGNFKLGDTLDEQDAVVALLESRDPYGADSPTYVEAIGSPDAVDWQAAMQEEMDSLRDLEVHVEVDPPADKKKLLKSRWLLGTKRTMNGDIKRRKAPKYQWPTASFDVKTAYLHSKIDDDIWVQPPPGHPITPGKVWKLCKALYGTKQAGRCWWLHLRDALAGAGFQVGSEDMSTYVYRDGSDIAFLWIHVDDGLLIGSSDGLMGKLKVVLSKLVTVKWDKELASLVGIRIRQIPEGYTLQQPALISKLLTMDDSSATSNVPLADTTLVSNPLTTPDRNYLLIIGVLLYLAQGTRPDISFATHYLARFSLNPDNSHWTAVKKLVAYVCATRHFELQVYRGRMDRH
ncbi:hypothetical protein PCANC_09768 [Puccinia coronata f. sp. avenae]|uniref:Integrase catalytic domain-containing protein n=1 Tax=Puccinia coronata f. sp. avenae TaxID=200324 RepID=A0A2N5VTA7_9BASI|nr:hypothetical protein PCANC_09768 [Puccinia coronata f. sp. avenae]